MLGVCLYNDSDEEVLSSTGSVAQFPHRTHVDDFCSIIALFWTSSKVSLSFNIARALSSSCICCFVWKAANL